MSAQDIYEPIKWWQIRLLKLHPGEGDEVLEGELRIANVIEAESGAALHIESKYVEYEALSYCWGDPELTTDMIVNELPSRVTTSLGKALRRLRYKDRNRWLWCDALCINQDDDTEKSHQVQKILTIFSRAFMVVIWLGDSGPCTAVAIQQMNEEEAIDWLEELDGPIPEELWEGLCDLYSRPWILRIWVQQETYAARKALVYCGPDVVDLSTFKSVAKEFLEVYSNRLDPLHPTIKAVELMSASPSASRKRHARLEHTKEAGGHEDCQCSSSSRRVPLEEWDNPECALYHFRGLNASRPADHVYSVLGMTNCRITDQHGYDKGDSALPSLSVDFSRSASRVFQDFTKYVLNRDRDLGLLLRHTPVSVEKNDLGLPSWCPDYRDFRTHRTVRAWNETHEVWLDEFPVDEQREWETGHLMIAGVKIAEVVGTGGVGRRLGWWNSDNQELSLSVSGYEPHWDSGVKVVHKQSLLTQKSLKICPKVGMLGSRILTKGRKSFKVDRLDTGDVLVAPGIRVSGFRDQFGSRILVLKPNSDGTFLYVDMATSFRKEKLSAAANTLFGLDEDQMKWYKSLVQDFDLV